MRRGVLLRWAIIIFTVCIALVVNTVYVWSTAILNRKYDVPLTSVNIPHDSASIHEGERLVRIEHCSDCHGARFTGGTIENFTAPNLTRVLPSYSDAELERLLKYGVRKDGRSVYAMPIYMYHQLQDESYTKIIAYLRTLKTLPSTPGIPDENSYSFPRRLKIINGDINPEIVKPDVPRQYIPEDTTCLSEGRYLAMTLCTSCHGADLKGFDGFSPNLIIASSYPEKDFFRLLRTGIALGDRELGLMSKITRNNLRYLNDDEINAIYAYLKTRPTR